MTDASDRAEFASPEWVEIARELVEKALADEDLTGVSVKFCEEFTDPPTHLSPDGSPIGWHIVIEDGAVTLGAGVIDAPSKVVADYQTVVPLARMIIDRDDPEQAAELARLMGDAIAAGKFTPPSVEASGLALPALADLHNILAARTA